MRVATPTLVWSPRYRRRDGSLSTSQLAPLLGSHDQLFLAVQAVNALGIHMPSLAPQQHCQPPVPVADVGSGQFS